MRKVSRLLLPRLFDHLAKQRVRDARAVTEAHLVSFARKLARRKLAASSQTHYLMAVRRFFAFLLKRRLILHDPAAAIRLPRRFVLPRHVLSEAQARRLLSAPCSTSPLDRRDRAILEVLYGAGLRLGECLRLGIGDVDLGQGHLLVRDGKGKKDRFVPLTARAVEAIMVYLSEGRPMIAKYLRETALFLSARGQSPSETAVRLMLQRHARAAKIDGRIYPHALRHSCATHLLRGGADVRHVQEILGHRNIDTTAIYTRVAIKDLRDVIQRCHPREDRDQRRRPRTR